MTCEVQRWGENDEDHLPGELKAMVFHCDAEKCDVIADDDLIQASGGLRYMGWWAAGGKHYCPKHFDQGGPRQW